MSIAQAGIAAWHDYMHGGSDPEKLKAMLADDAVFHSPVVHTPQEGKAKVFAYLHAAAHVLEVRFGNVLGRNADLLAVIDVGDAALAGSSHNYVMSQNTQVLCKNPDGSQSWYTLDAERTTANAIVLKPV